MMVAMFFVLATSVLAQEGNNNAGANCMSECYYHCLQIKIFTLSECRRECIKACRKSSRDAMTEEARALKMQTKEAIEYAMSLPLFQ
ncbi:hypothetical protein RHGRI_025466 [Rhododendron griersonianum]|uniref:Uncharacterized protein n=1 Tax=Rhododendron griersonianum TaxID=479676 RepID=A0AAV6IPH3_9ERIC|nr:hypothetical protein RHGRI_025466 [Rhododendron griersonianum]